MTQPDQTPAQEGEILISGVDTGPLNSGNETPTEMHARFQGVGEPELDTELETDTEPAEPDDEDG
ncbi:hypothetical protein [Deinococcus sp.]|uniref:hypothetical protein n=1 Tax=Deinococcus sp. TaxID=47478 RepID=UPI0025DB06A6|nr:hypothetical protein [Deinococcus sp.]